MTFKIIHRRAVIAAVVIFTGGIFSGEVLAAKNNNTPTSFHHTIEIPNADSKRTNNNEDAFFKSDDRHNARMNRPKDRNKARRDAKVNGKGEEEARTRKIQPSTQKKGRRNRMSRQEKVQKMRPAAVNESSAGSNE